MMESKIRSGVKHKTDTNKDQSLGSLVLSFELRNGKQIRALGEIRENQNENNATGSRKRNYPDVCCVHLRQADAWHYQVSGLFAN